MVSEAITTRADQVPSQYNYHSLTYTEDPEESDDDDDGVRSLAVVLFYYHQVYDIINAILYKFQVNPSTSKPRYQITFTEEPEDDSDSDEEYQV